MARPPDPIEFECRQAIAAAAASDATLDRLRREIIRRVTPVLSGAGIASNRAVCRLEPTSTRLEVRFHLPVAVSAATEHALAVRVLDAVRGAGRTFGPVHVSVCDET